MRVILLGGVLLASPPGSPALPQDAPPEEVLSAIEPVMIALEQGNAAEAVRLAEEAVARHPDQPCVEYLLAQALVAAQDHARARPLLDGLSVRLPQAAGPHYLIAVIEHEGGNSAGARRSLEVALELDAEHVQARALLDALEQGEGGETGAGASGGVAPGAGGDELPLWVYAIGSIGFAGAICAYIMMGDRG